MLGMIECSSFELCGISHEQSGQDEKNRSERMLSIAGSKKAARLS
jgi:hypothetical protein